MAKKMFNTDEFDALFDDASESSDMFSGLFSENINPDTEKVTDPNEIVKGGDVDPDGTEPDVKSSFESLFEDDDDSAEGEETEGDDKPAEGEDTDEDDKPAESFESLFEDDDDSAEGEGTDEDEADGEDDDSEDLDSDLFEDFIL
jgi:hypothetical protein